MIGTTLGHYRIVEQIGAGGMGVVYRARDERLDRDVAIKVLPEAVAKNPDRLRRFEREAKAVAALSHPNILEIFDFDTEGDITYAVTELLEGQSLRQHITRTVSDWRSAVTICAAIADGLAAAHKGEIIHRDLKPENVFLTVDDQIKILDFGLAKVHHPEAADSERSEAPTGSMATAAGQVMGSVGYMSPEQLRGEPVDHRTDIFALGCLLHELLCGQRAFPGNSAAEVTTAILSRQPEPLRQTGCDVPVDVQPIVDRCLEKSPAKRFQNASDLSFALRSLITGSGSGDLPPAPGRLRTWRWVAAAAGIVTAAVIGVVILLGDRAAKAPAGTSTGLNPNLVAVAAFENRTARPELDNLGLVVADWLTNSLARIGAIDVVPIGLGVESRAGATSPQEVADATGAGIVVTGAYYLEGDTLRFQANLTDATRGSLLRSLEPSVGPIDQPMTAIEPMASEVAGAVASLFASWDTGFDQNLRPPGFEAYREYIAGMEFFFVDNQRALEHYRRATELDPDFVAPQLMTLSMLRASARFSEARAIVGRLSDQRQRLNPFERFSLEYHIAKLDGDNQRAVLQMRRCEELAPRSAFIKFGLAFNLQACARPREALEVISAINDPGQWSGTGACSLPFIVLTDTQHVLGFYDGELESARQGVEACGNQVYFQRCRARALIGKGEINLAEEALDEGLRAPDARRMSLLLFLDIARELDAHGHPAIALNLAERGVAHAQDHLGMDEASEWQRLRYVQLLTMLGRLDEALEIMLALNEEIPDDDDVLGWLGIVATEHGDKKAAERFSTMLRDLDHPYLLGWDSFYRAGIAAHLGRSDEAMGLLREAFSRGYEWNIGLHGSLELKPLRNHPEFEAILNPDG